jgi:hypothetical protein
MAGGLKKEVEEVVATPSVKKEEAVVAPAVEAVVETAPVAGFHSRDFSSK